MNSSYEELKKQKAFLKLLEKKVELSYYNLGKKTQEFVEQESIDINQLVDEIVYIKKNISFLEDKIEVDQAGKAEERK